MIYKDSLSLLTDLYQISMAYSYWKNNRHETNSIFHLFYRKNPFNGNYAIAAGLDYVIEFLENFEFRQDDIEYLATLTGNDNKQLFEKEFLNYLKNLKFTCTLDAVAEGTIVFPNQPILKIKGPIIQCQLLETILLNIINFQTLIATKASRVCEVAQNDSVMEFGLRRAQGFDGGISASRAAYIGGCHATSNVLAGKLFGIPVIGTHAHSWVMSHNNEEEAFAAYSFAMPNNCIFLVDTYDTQKGIEWAIKEGKKMRKRGYEMNGIRLDSGDLCNLSIHARKMLDEAGFENAKIVASNDLDEYKISNLKKNGAKINSWGVGTNLVTAADQPALGGVYKLGSIETEHGWEDKMKFSNDVEKNTLPGSLDIYRYYYKYQQNRFDIISNNSIPKNIYHDIEHNFSINEDYSREKLLITIFDQGKLVYRNPEISSIRDYVKDQKSDFPNQVFSIDWEYKYPVFLDKELYEKQQKMLKVT